MSASPPPDNPRGSFAFWLRDSFAAGVVLVLPFVVTIWLVVTVVGFIDTRVIPWAPETLQPLLTRIPGAGVVVAVLTLTLVGALTKNLIGRLVVRTSERFVTGLPLVRSVYGGSKQIFKQIAAPDRTSFKEAVLVPFAGAITIGFVTNEETAEITQSQGEGLVAVYVPQAPIPTTGFLLYFPRSVLTPIDIGPEEALKRVFSLGMAKPDAESEESLARLMRS